MTVDIPAWPASTMLSPATLPASTPQTKGRVYIAGPMRGVPGLNFSAFDEARDRGKSLGWSVVSPADLDRAVGINEQTDPDTLSRSTVLAFVLRDIESLINCDAIALLPGWEHSRGALAEKTVAEWVGLKILDARTFEPLDATVLDEAKRVVYNDRAQDYGHPLDECRRIAAFWTVILGVEVKTEQVPLCMIAMKLSRQMNRHKKDNAVDMAGYAECVQRIHDEAKRRGQQP